MGFKTKQFHLSFIRKLIKFKEATSKYLFPEWKETKEKKPGVS